jgi:TolB-like protein/DNA-binding winged helix-turn-helix (wHTH) protein/Tfp pilus assembly protein PilF
LLDLKLTSVKSFGPFRLDGKNHCLWRGQERVAIAPKAFDVLRYLVENPARLVTQDELLSAVWPDTYVNPEILRKYILEIRKILGDRSYKPQFIETVTKRGYRFVAPVTEEPETGSPDLASAGQGEEAQGRAEVVSGGQERPRTKRRGLAAVIGMALIAIAGAGGYFWIGGRRAKAPVLQDTSIAVLPFADMSAGRDQEYFSDGLTEELINDLAKVPGLRVVARSSAFQFKGKNEDLREVGRKLRVANILEGSVRKEGGHVRITAELIKASDGFHLWSETYDREIGNALTAQDEIARAVTDALQVELLAAHNAIAESTHTRNSEAYQAYLQGQYFVARGQDKEDLNRALSYAEQAIRVDPNYAAAWAQRAHVLERLARVALIPGDDGFRRARESAERAVALDPNLSAGYLVLATVKINHDWDWEGADASLKEAGRLAPGSAAVLGERAYLSRMLGRSAEAIGLYKQAIALDPLRANYYLALGWELYCVGRYNEAEAALEKTQELNAQISSLHSTRARILLAEGRVQEAVGEAEKETGEWERLTIEAMAYHAIGRREDSETALKRLIATHQDDSAFQIAEAYAFLGDYDKAFEWLERAYRQRDPGTPEVQTDPPFRNVHGDRRYTDLVSKMRLPM